VREEPAVRIRPTATNTPAHSGGAPTRRVGPTRQRDIGPGGRGPRRGRNCARAPLTLLFVHAIKLGLFRKQKYLNSPIAAAAARTQNQKSSSYPIRFVDFGSGAQTALSDPGQSLLPSVIPQFSLSRKSGIARLYCSIPRRIPVRVCEIRVGVASDRRFVARNSVSRNRFLRSYLLILFELLDHGAALVADLATQRIPGLILLLLDLIVLI
jgi:hypothetical protein